MVGSDGCTTVRMYLLSLNCTHKHGQDGTLYVMCILPQKENIYTESVSPRDEQEKCLRILLQIVLVREKKVNVFPVF